MPPGAPACPRSPSVCRLLYETAVKDRRLGRIWLLDEADVNESLCHLLVGPIRYVAVETKEFQLGHLIVVGLLDVLAGLLGVFHQNVNGLFLVSWIVEPTYAAPVAARECRQCISVLLGPGHVGGPHRERDILCVGLGVAEV